MSKREVSDECDTSDGVPVGRGVVGANEGMAVGSDEGDGDGPRVGNIEGALDGE